MKCFSYTYVIYVHFLLFLRHDIRGSTVGSSTIQAFISQGRSKSAMQSKWNMESFRARQSCIFAGGAGRSGSVGKGGAAGYRLEKVVNV